MRATADAITSEGLGGSDCERIASGLLAQPVNAVTSLTYVVVGLLIVSRSGRARLDPVLARTAPWLAGLYGLAVAAEGLGSVLYHGPQTWGAQWLHDWAIVAILGLIALTDASVLTRRPVLSGAAAGVLLTGSAVAMVAAPAVGTALSAVVVLAAVAGEVLVMARGLRVRGRRGLDGPWGLLVPGSMLALALTAYVLGRTGGYACSPDSVLQLHGMWHVLTALTFGWWARVALFAPAGAHTGRPAPDHDDAAW